MTSRGRPERGAFGDAYDVGTGEDRPPRRTGPPRFHGRPARGPREGGLTRAHGPRPSRQPRRVRGPIVLQRDCMSSFRHSGDARWRAGQAPRGFSAHSSPSRGPAGPRRGGARCPRPGHRDGGAKLDLALVFAAAADVPSDTGCAGRGLGGPAEEAAGAQRLSPGYC